MTRKEIDAILWGQTYTVQDKHGITQQIQVATIDGVTYYAAIVGFGAPMTTKRVHFFATEGQAADADISSMKNVVCSYTVR